MIDSLQIRNFQSHKKTDLEFSPGLNVIVGSSDAGKSAIIRALRWVVWNKPTGNAFRSTWGGETSVKVGMGNQEITRIKDNAEEYILTTNNDSLSFKAFGKEGIPSEITNALNLTEINLQSQLDQPFLFSSTPGEVASYFNRVAGLEKIDRAQQNVEREIRSLTSTVKFKEEEQKKLIGNLSDFDFLEKYEIELEVLEEMDVNLSKLTKNTSRLIKLFNSLVDIENELDETSSILQYEPQVNSILADIENRDDLIASKNRLGKVITDFHNTKAFIQTYQHRISFENTVLSILEKIDTKKTLNTPITRLNTLVSSIRHIEVSLAEKSRDLARKMEIFKKEMPEICPLCDSTIKISINEKR